MSATSTTTIVKASVGWSIGLSIPMILAGFLAIAVPQAAGIAVNLLVARLLVFSGGALWCLPGTRAAPAGLSGSCCSVFSMFS